MAALASMSGTVHFYTELAFRMWLDSEVALTCKARETNGSLHPDFLPPSFPKVGESNLTVDEQRLEGYTIGEWAAFAKKKAAIASNICKVNGLLKAKVTSDNGSLLVQLNARTGGDWRRLPNCDLTRRGLSSRSMARYLY
jgi:hypothetical protein